MAEVEVVVGVYLQTDEQAPVEGNETFTSDHLPRRALFIVGCFIFDPV